MGWGTIVELRQGSGVVFHPATGLDTPAIAQVQADARRRILRAFVRRGLIEADDALQMSGYQRLVAASRSTP